MTRFLIQAAGVKPILAVIAAHGLTDLDSRRWVAPYTASLLLPLPSPAVTGVFCVASVCHFASDVGFKGSVFVHCAVLAAGLFFGVQAAFKAMMCYLALVHVPFHYLRCCIYKRCCGAKAVAKVSLLAALLSFQMGDWVPLTDGMQRLATAHIFTESAISSSFPSSKDQRRLECHRP